MFSSLRILVGSVVVAVVATAVAVRVGSAPPPAAPTYVGQESCLSSGCHAGAYSEVSSFQGAEPFRETMHQKIHLRPTPQTVVIDHYFENDTVLRAYDPRIKVAGKDTFLIEFSKSPDRKDYFLQLRFSGGGDSTPKMKVAYTYGGNGWIQRFLLQVNGSYYVSPFQYILPGYRKRLGVGGRIYYLDITRWYRVDSASGEGNLYEFNSNTFRQQAWDKNCSMCHVNGFDVKRTVNGTDTSWNAQWFGTESGDSALIDQNIKVGCESCHGPGSDHAANPRADNIVSPSLFPTTFAGTDLKYDLCNQCHNRIKSTQGVHSFPYDDSLQIPYIPGQDMRKYIQHYYAAMSVWGDGVASSAHHQQGQDVTRSGHYRQHVFKNGCWSCHLAHSNNKDGLPFQLDRNWYSLKKGEGCQNLACHPTFADTGFVPELGRTVNLHTKHSQSQSTCVNCHFTYSISISFDTVPGRSLYDFTDHSFRVMKPNLTRLYATRGVVGMINTCAASCHRNGRGSRNMSDTTPEAPSYGITDGSLIFWKEPSDLALADSLWFHFKRLFPEYIGAVKESNERMAQVAITRVVPNPFREKTTIEFSLPKRGDIEFMVYDVMGGFVRTIAAGPHEAGTYTATWDGKDEFGDNAVAGLYVARLSVNGRSTTTRLILQR